MGQWGAYGYAKDQGWAAERILGHYYGGTTLGTLADAQISVRLQAGTTRRSTSTPTPAPSSPASPSDRGRPST